MAVTNTSYASNEQTTQTFRGALKAEVAIIFPTVDIATSPAILFKGATVRHTDGKLYMSNGTIFEQIQGSGGSGETAITIKQKYESNPDTNAFTDAEKSKLSGLGNYDDSAIISSLSNKVDKITGKQLSDENYTLGEKQKLAGLESSKFLGLYTSLSALQAAHPTASDGNYADVDLGVGSDTQRYIWDVNDAKYIASGAGTPLTAAQVKSLYESNPDTNAYTNAEKSKLASITEIFTTALKNAYDSAVTWISTNGANLIAHLSRTDNPHGVTKAQVGLGSVVDGANMAKSVYDPTGINADAFDWNNFTNKPTIPSAQVNSDWSAVGGVAEILNKPTIPTIDPNTTIQGNDFNGANQLVKLDGDGKLPAVDGSQLTGIEGLPSGGTTGQTLIKQSSTDFDAAWEDLPSEIVWVADEASRPLTGDATKAYVSKATGMIYRWDGALMTYMLIGGGGGAPNFTATGTNTYIVTNTPALTSLPDRTIVLFTNANTGAATIKFDSLAALPILMDGFALVEKNIPANSRKELIIAPDGSHYQLQSANIIAPVSEERAMTLTPAGFSKETKIINPYNYTGTTGAQLEAQTWIADQPVIYLGEAGEVRYWNNYKYECTWTNVWWRTPYNYVIQDIIIGSVNDSGGKKTSAQMAALYPNAIPPQIVWGTAGKYEYMGSLIGWAYYENKI